MRGLSVKVGSVICVVAMVTVTFQQMQLAGVPANVEGGSVINDDEAWESARPVTLSRGDSISPSAQAVGNGIVHLVWIDTRAGSPQVYYKRSGDGGQTFSSDKRVSNVGSQPGRPSVAVSADGLKLALSWDAVVDVENHSGRAVLFRDSMDGGMNFGKTTFVAFGKNPQLLIHNGDLILSFLQDDWTRGVTHLRALRIPLSSKTQALPVLLLASTLVILIVAGVGWAMNAFPFISAIILGLIALVLMVLFYSMIPDEEPAFAPNEVESSLGGFEEQWGTALWLFGLVDISLGKVATALGSKTTLAVEWELIIGFVFVMTAFVAGGIAEGCDGKDGACAIGIFSLAVSGLAIILSANAILSAKSGLTWGQKAAYVAFTLIMAGASIASFFADSGYVFKNCR